MPLAIGEILNHRYRIDRQIGQGGFGAVYRAYDLTLQQPCALKENLNTQPEVQRQFEREALILARLRHPNLPRVIDHFVLPERGQYLVMDFVEGFSLHYLLKLQKDPLPEAKALAWIDQVCRALTYLHQQNPPIIHRDIKPQNIIITPEGQAMLVDFGLSKIYDEQIKTTTGARGLTFGYAPPEQYGQGRTDARSDIYALGSTLYTMLTRQRPPDAIERVVNNTPLPPLRQFSPDISLRVEQAVFKAMEPTTTERFESVETFRQALAPPPPGPTVPVRPQLKRSPQMFSTWIGGAVLGILVLIFLLATVGLGYWVWQVKPGNPPTSTIANATFTPLPAITNTSTPQPPTNTPLAPTATALPPTNTPIPPTNTPPPTASPTSEYEFEVVKVEKQSKQLMTIFEGTISDTNGNPMDGVFVQATCGTYSTISFPSGAVPWKWEKGPDWAPGYYNINLAKPQPCAWQLTVVDTDDRQTVKATLSAPQTIEVGLNESPIIVNWRKNY